MKPVTIGDLTTNIPTSAADRLYQELTGIIGNGKLTRGNVVAILLSLLQLVETYDDNSIPLSDMQKKVLILNAVHQLIDEKINDPQEAMETKLLVQLTLPSAVDIFVNMDKNKLQINLKKGWKKCIACCKTEEKVLEK